MTCCHRSGLAAAVLAATLRPAYSGFPRQVARVLAHDPVLDLEQLAVNGSDLVALGLSGPQIGRVLRRLLAAVIDNPQRNRKPWLLGVAHRLSTGEA